MNELPKENMGGAKTAEEVILHLPHFGGKQGNRVAVNVEGDTGNDNIHNSKERVQRKVGVSAVQKKSKRKKKFPKCPLY